MSEELTTMLIGEFAESRKAKKVTHSLTEALKVFLGTETEVFRRQEYLRASQAWETCSREVVLRNLLPLPDPVTTKNNVGMVMRMTVGSFLHSFLQNEVLGPMGVLYGRWIRREDQFKEGPVPFIEGFYPHDGNHWVFVEETVEIAEWRVKGHTDGEICFNRLAKFVETGKPVLDPEIPLDLHLLEIKTTDDAILRDIKAREELALIDQYKCQAALYQFAKKRPSTLFVYIDRKYFQIHCFEYVGEKKYLDHARQKAHECWTLPLEKKLPPRCAECISAVSKRAIECPYSEFCFCEMPELVFEL